MMIDHAYFCLSIKACFFPPYKHSHSDLFFIDLVIFVVGLPKHCHAILSFFCLFKDCFSCSFEHSHAGLFSCWSKDLFSSIYPSQRRTTETGRIRWNSGAFQKQDSIAVFGLRFQLAPDHSWLWIRCSHMIVVSGTVPLTFYGQQEMGRIPWYSVR